MKTYLRSLHSKLSIGATLLVAVMTLSGCATGRNGQTVYKPGMTHQVFEMKNGTVTSVRAIVIESDHDNWIGRWGGGAIGATAPWAFASCSDYSPAIWAISAVSGVGGAIIGDAVENAVKTHHGQEIHVALDRGEVIMVVQESKPRFARGDRVQVMFGGDSVTVVPVATPASDRRTALSNRSKRFTPAQAAMTAAPNAKLKNGPLFAVVQ